MKTNLAISEVETSGSLNSREFTIDANAKMFDMLSTAIYSDKPLAVVRELSCNAYDSHVVAGNLDTPFQVHLPNELEPWFSIKDFGTGISDDKIETLYCRYGGSDKTGSNSVIGAFGLGSKAPFAYVDSFTIISRVDGVQRTYVAYKGPRGVPIVDLQDEQPTDEPNGVEVMMPVESDDFYVFRQKVETVLKRFSPLPTIVGGRAELVAPKYIIDGPTWGLRTVGGYGSGGAVAIQGNVPYPISRSAAGLTQDENEILALDLDIRFDIGDLEVAVSREALQYDPRTLASIKARINQIAVDLPSHFMSHFDNCADHLAARRLFVKLVQNMGTGLRKTLEKTLRWKGQDLSDNYDFDVKDLPGAELVYLNKKSRIKGTIPMFGRTALPLYASHEYKVFWDDRGTRVNFQRRLHEAFDNFWDRDEVIVIVTASEDAKNTILERLGNPDCVKIADVYVPPRVNNRGGSVRTKVKLLGQWGRWEDSTIDPSLGGHFVHLYKKEARHKDRDFSRYSDAVNSAIKLGIITGPVYGIPASCADVLKKHKGWTEVLPLIEAQTHVLALDPMIGSDKANRDELARFSGVDFTCLVEQAQTPLKRQKTAIGKFKTALEKLKSHAVPDPRLAPLLSLMGIFHIPVKTKKPIVSLQPFVEAAATAYPLFTFSGFTQTLAEQWLEYINFIDTRKVQ
jgi:hypothetical protein